ncbi:glycerol-3-phosphate 1-O-acyltransferase PlsB [Sulfuricystis multivorans]|uniref:glycerol-3-phosphate 1-O-acyltransferase PlsB n=1 Tax=Sulfuricystis multivorans TaxID=2211108 RepID=UPI000F82E576|nr:glycerol-3-phosphate 1-O-acyltransferase PlsB [Sulfuricystis multivorans]
MASAFLRLARRLLHLWVRLRLFPENAAALGIDPARPVCYALNEYWLSDRLVLHEAVARAGLPAVDRPLDVAQCRLPSAEFALSIGWRLMGRARAFRGAPPRLSRLVACLARDPAADVQIVPVTVLWGRAPRQQDGVLRALLAESWQRRHPLGHWLAVLLHGRQTHVHFGAPYSLRAMLADVAEPARAAKKTARVLRAHFRRQRERFIGPDISHRHTQVEALLATPAVQAAIEAEAAQHGILLDAARDRARRHALAIASDFSYAVARALEIFLTWLWTRLFDGVEVRHLDVLQRIAPGQSIVYLPCHRSHVDYLLMSYVIYRAGLVPPHIAAGDNLDLPLLGRILRGGGAFFLRRSFKGDPLYASVFAEYLHYLLAQGFPVEYFIEGGRSRNGRLLPPKTGLLAMTIQSFLRGHERPLVFVPVYLGYEKLPEGPSFVAELAGRPKRRESWLGLLAALRVLRRHFGRVYVNFGVPLALSDWLDASYADWRIMPPTNEAQRAMVAAIAAELARRINAAALVNPMNLVALALLSAPEFRAGEAALARQIENLAALVDDAHLAAPPRGEDNIAIALRLAAVRRVDHPSGAQIEANAFEAALLAYFRNNVLHLFALSAVIAWLLVRRGSLDTERLQAAVACLLGPLRESLCLPWSDASLPTALDEALVRLAGRGLIERANEAWRAPAPDAPTCTALGWLAGIIEPEIREALPGSGRDQSSSGKARGKASSGIGSASTSRSLRSIARVRVPT